jgi:hypothetical protein
MDAISILSTSHRDSLRLYKINKDKALGSLLLDAVGATIPSLEEAEKLGKRVATHLKGLEKTIASVNRSRTTRRRVLRATRRARSRR